MNIFATFPNADACAVYLDDKRVVKMVLETCQLLSTAVNVSGGKGPYKTTHVNHPCSIWARQNKGNYAWLVRHFESLLAEYTRRYGKTHKCQQYLSQLRNSIKYIPPGDLTPHPNCTTFKHVEDVHKAYRLYMNEKWNNDKLQPRWNKVYDLARRNLTMGA